MLLSSITTYLLTTGEAAMAVREIMLPTIPCAVTVCPCNIKINAAGQCKMGVTAIEMEKKG